MLHKDYLLEVIAQFVEVVTEALGLAHRKHDPTAVQEAEEAVAGLLDLDAQVALKLSPDSLVTMMLLSGIGDSLAEYASLVTSTRRWETRRRLLSGVTKRWRWRIRSA